MTCARKRRPAVSGSISFTASACFPWRCLRCANAREDIPELAAYFVRQACARFHVPEPRLIERELERARQYDWPGNVRELQNVVERAVILAQDGTLTLELPEPKRMAAAAAAASHSRRDSGGGMAKKRAGQRPRRTAESQLSCVRRGRRGRTAWGESWHTGIAPEIARD